MDEQVDEKYVDRLSNHVLWRENVGEMYTLLRERLIEQPSMTLEWLSGNLAVIGNRKSAETEVDPLVFVIEPEKSGVPLWSAPVPSFINRARAFVDGDKTYFAVIGACGVVSIFEYGNADKKPLEYKVHTTNGFGLAWSSEGALASAADDGTLVLATIDFAAWTVETKQTSVADGINDVQWSGSDLVAACEDGKIRTFNTALEQQQEWQGEENGGPINCIAVNPLCVSMAASSGNDNLVTLWDLRDTQAPLAIIGGHDDQINTVKFSPTTDGLLATSSADSRVILWDIRRFGANQDPEDAEEAAPELVFVHSGHPVEASEVSWHPTRPWVLGTTAENNSVQIWTPNELTTGIKTAKPALPESLV